MNGGGITIFMVTVHYHLFQGTILYNFFFKCNIQEEFITYQQGGLEILSVDSSFTNKGALQIIYMSEWVDKSYLLM